VGEVARSFRVVVDENWIDALPPAIAEAIHARMSVIDVPAGETLTTAGRPATRMFQVVEGYLRVNGVHRNGSAALMAIYIPGNCLGEGPLIARRRYNHTAVALVDSRVRALAARDFWELYHLYHQIPETLCRKFVGLISRQMDMREASATLSLGQRIAMMFHDFVEHCPGAARPDGAAIAFPFTQWDIAALFDVSRQSVHREISRFRALGILEKRAGVWVVADRRQLSSLASKPAAGAKKSGRM
jgi:CRP/FNR family transcriptional regulator, cyclic AMP receptor protein